MHGTGCVLFAFYKVPEIKGIGSRKLVIVIWAATRAADDISVKTSSHSCRGDHETVFA